MNTVRIAKTLTNFSSSFRHSFLANAALVAICAILFASPQALAQAEVIFTRTTATGELWPNNPYSAGFVPTQTGDYTLNFNMTDAPIAGQPGGGVDATIFLDAVVVEHDATNTVLFQDGFEVPDLTSGAFQYLAGSPLVLPWTYTNFGGVIEGNSGPWGGDVGDWTPPQGTQRGFLQAFGSPPPLFLTSKRSMPCP